MPSLFSKEVLSHPIVLGAVGVAVVIALGSGAYYFLESRGPSSTWATPVYGPIEEVVTGTGVVEPAQNPNLAFVAGGRVASVKVAVGQAVGQGQILASLDTAALGASLAQAQAAVAAAQAKLDEMKAGPRAVDLASARTAVSQAQLALTNAYANVPAAIAGAYGASYSGVHSDTDTLFAQLTSANPSLSFQTTNSQAAQNTLTARVSLDATLAQWQSMSAALSANSSQAQLDAALASSVAYAAAARDYAALMLEALSGAITTTSFPQSSITAAQTAVEALQTSANGLVTSLQGAQQQIATDKLAVQSAQDALNLVNAGATPQDIEAQQAAVEGAQAQVAAAQAALANALVVAPFSGTVSSVAVKAGQTVDANTTAVSLTPLSALGVEVYVSESDAAKLKVGDLSQVTLDAYGASRIFPATLSSIDASPTMQNGVPSYKATLQFAQNDSAIAPGMTANVTIIAAQKDNALIIPSSAVLQSGNAYFVLVPAAGGTQERQVTLGIQSTSTDEVTSGLTSNDQFFITAH